MDHFARSREAMRRPTYWFIVTWIDPEGNEVERQEFHHTDYRAWRLLVSEPIASKPGGKMIVHREGDFVFERAWDP